MPPIERQPAGGASPDDPAGIVVHYAPRTRAFTVIWFFEELGRPYRIAAVDLKAGDNRTPGFLALNPMGKVPVVVEAGKAISETAAIIAYFADKYALSRLAPPIGRPVRADYLRWLFFAPSVIEPMLLQSAHGWEGSPSALGWGQPEDVVRTIEAALDGRTWLTGDGFTAADLLVASALGFALQKGVFPTEGKIAAFCQRARQRPAFRRAVAIERDWGARMPP